MAQISNEIGVPTVAADTTAPNDQQRIQTNPSQFGGAIAEGEQQLGAGVSKAGQFFGQVQTDDAVNSTLDAVNNHLNAFRALRGQDALNAQASTQQAISDAFKAGRDNLSTPEQQLAYDQQTRTYQQRYVSGVMATHADEQAKDYAVQVNNSSILNANNAVSLVANDQAKVDALADDARRGAYRNVHVAGNEGDQNISQAATDKAAASIYKTQVDTIAVNDPSRALALATKLQPKLGDLYPQLADSLRTRAAQQSGQQFVTSRFDQVTANPATGNYADPKLPVFAQAAQAIPGGYSPQGAANVVRVESGGNPNAGAGTSHEGLTQFGDPAWAQYGQGSRRDPFQSIMAAQRYAAANRPILEAHIGRPATDADLYMAHQQGPGGAVKLLTNPNVRAGSLVGDAAIRGNGGDPNAPASAFTNMWTLKFGGNGLPTVTPGGGQAMQMPAAAMPFTAPTDEDMGIAAPPASVPGALPPPESTGVPPTAPPAAQEAAAAPIVTAKQDMYAQIDEAYKSGKLTYEAAEHARVTANQMFAQKQITDNEDERTKRNNSEKATGSIVSRILSGNQYDPNTIIHQISQDPNILPDAKLALAGAVEKWSGSDVASSQRSFGPGYWSAYKQITAGPDDPQRISDPTELLKRAGPGGDLTLDGVAKLQEIRERMLKGVNDQNVVTTQRGMFDYAKKNLSFQKDALDYPGAKPLLDPKGEAIFNAQFIPKYESAVDAWEKSGKSPWDPSPNNPLTQAGVDNMIEGLRPKAQMERDRVFAQGENHVGPATDPIPLAPSTQVNPQAWAKIVSLPPTNGGGADQWTHASWALVLNDLISNPTPERIQAWNESKFGKQGYDGAEIVRQLSPAQADLHRGTTVAPTAAPAAPYHPSAASHGRGGYVRPAPSQAETDRLMNALPDISAGAKPVSGGSHQPPSLQKPHDKLPLGRGTTQ